MPENNQKRSISEFNELAVTLAKRIPAVIVAFVAVFLIFIIYLYYSTGYLPANERIYFLCFTTTVGFIALVLICVYIYRIVVYVIENNKANLLD